MQFSTTVRPDKRLLRRWKQDLWENVKKNEKIALIFKNISLLFWGITLIFIGRANVEH